MEQGLKEPETTAMVWNSFSAMCAHFEVPAIPPVVWCDYSIPGRPPAFKHASCRLPAGPP